jgi:hypothetical protein
MYMTVAHQYRIRLEKQEEEKNNLLFELSDVNLDNATIKLISKKEASEIIIEYEWLKKMPGFSKYYFGLFFNINDIEYLGGVLVYSPEYSLNTGVWDKYSFTDKLLLLSRGVCLWWTPKNTASYFISRANKWIKENTHYRIITATVDPMAGEIGTIYQSLNWYYVGLMNGNYSGNKESKRMTILIDGKQYSTRYIRKKYGTMKKDEILKIHPDAVFVPQYRKRRYFYFMDSKYNNRKYLDNISHLIQPYPKRNETDISGVRNSLLSIETREKMSISRKGKPKDQNWIKKAISAAGSEEAKKYGRPKTDEDKRYLSENSPKFWLGKKRDEETKIKVSQTKKAKGLKPPNTKKMVMVDSDGKLVKIYESAKDCAFHSGYGYDRIYDRLRGKYKNNLEHKFYYLEDYTGEYDLEKDLYIKPKIN